jgi:hypothetical protein
MSEDQWINLDGHYVNMSRILAVCPVTKWNSTFASNDHVVAGNYCLQIHLDGDILTLTFNAKENATYAYTRLIDELGITMSSAIGTASSSTLSSSTSS